MVKAPLEGGGEERAEEEDEEQDLEGGEWEARGRAPDQEGSAYVLNVVPQLRINLESRACRSTALNVAHPWSEDNASRSAPEGSLCEIATGVE